MNTRLSLALAASAALGLLALTGCGCDDGISDILDGSQPFADKPIYEDVGGPHDGGHDGGGGGDVEADGGVDVGPACGDSGICKKSQDCRCGECKPHYCTKDDDCNPGQICNLRNCTDSFLLCTGSSCGTSPDQCTCDIDGQKCAAANGKGACHYDLCDAQGQCPAGTSCFNTFCVVSLPCNGKCLDTQVCLTDRNECIPAPAGALNCDKKCDPGQLRVFKDPATSTYEVCKQIECDCVFLPNIAVGEYGHYCSVAVKGTDVYAAAYSRTYGDLVVTKFTAGSDDLVAADPATAQFVDGVPATGTLSGNPNGPRGGITDPGPDVGKYTSIAVGGDGNLAVAYYDVTNGDLKYAHSDGTKWTAHAVDGADGSDVGMYASLAFAKDGKPHIAYFQKFGPQGADFLKGALKLAVGKSATPASSADWDITVVESTVISCRGLCPTGQVCVAQAPLAACVQEQTDCTPACSKQKCIHDGTGAATCVDEATSPAPELNEGTGLFPSLVAAADGNDYIAYYDHTPIDLKTFKGNLKTAVIAGGTPTIAIQDGEDATGTDTGDVGRFASLAQDSSGAFGIAYFDATLNQLKYWRGAIGQQAVIGVVATGVTPGLKEFTGPDCSLAFDANKTPHIAYQNATDHTLMYAVRNNDTDPWPVANITTLIDPNDTTLQTKYGTGGYGFFTRQAIDGTTSYIVNLKVGFTNPDQPTPDNRLLLYKKKF